ncbi:MAG: 1,4-dihydroxy-6-naphthoate synthase [Fibromonadaceae bacterium]|jgi:1,4-dihydroxy-6-naphthoate synthase|nr:1,4-dihydroxy-6-naphthoate synthase [Fibromonadaceae bacterium]
MKSTLLLGISPCPNDTFIYQNLIEGTVKTPCSVSAEFADVQTLNEKVLDGALDMAKVSAAVFPLVKDRYRLLKSGGAMGYGCGPLLLSSAGENFSDEFPVYLPGKQTTAAALFNFWIKKKFPSVGGAGVSYMRFDELYRELCGKKIKQGVTIHEHRFTWQRDGLHLISDLGAFWEQELKVPIPLGCTVIKKDLGEELANEMDLCVQKSLQLAWERKEPVNEFIRKLAQIDDDAVILQHIKMFVNGYSMNMGDEGEKALQVLTTFLHSESLSAP